MFRTNLKLTLACSALLINFNSVMAAEVNLKPGPANDAKEVDISDVQNQYWKAHDKEFEVVQKKQYAKAGKFEVTPLFGIYQRVDFQDTKTAGGSLAYHFSEMWGAELMGYKMFSEDSLVLRRFKETRGATIQFNPEKYYLGASAMFTPIYAKFSFLGTKISHFDMYIAPGIGATRTESVNLTPSIAVGQKFWVTQKWNVRLEYRWMRYNDRIYTSEGATAIKNGGQGFYDDTINNQNLMLGVGFLFD